MQRSQGNNHICRNVQLRYRTCVISQFWQKKKQMEQQRIERITQREQRIKALRIKRQLQNVQLQTVQN